MNAFTFEILGSVIPYFAKINHTNFKLDSPWIGIMNFLNEIKTMYTTTPLAVDYGEEQRPRKRFCL